MDLFDLFAIFYFCVLDFLILDDRFEKMDYCSLWNGVGVLKLVFGIMVLDFNIFLFLDET